MERLFGRPTEPFVPESAVEPLPPGLEQIGRAARELTSPLDLAILAATAGFGAPAAGALRTLGRGGRVAANLVEPVTRGGFASRLVGEAAVGTGGVLGAQQAGERLPEDLPPAARTAIQLGTGVVGGGAALGGVAGAPAALRATRRGARQVPGAIERRLPREAVFAAGPEDESQAFGLIRRRAEEGQGQRLPEPDPEIRRGVLRSVRDAVRRIPQFIRQKIGEFREIPDFAARDQAERVAMIGEEASETVSRINALIRRSPARRQELEVAQAEQRREGVRIGRERAQEAAPGVGRMRAFLSGQAGRRVEQTELEPLARAETLGDLPDLTPTELATEAGIVPEDLNNLFTLIERKFPVGAGQEFKALDASRGLASLLTGQIPTNRQIGLLEDVFGSEFARTIRSQRPFRERAGEIAVELGSSVFRTLRSSYDFSALLRQAAVYSINPRRARQTTFATFDGVRAMFGRNGERVAQDLFTRFTDPNQNRWANALYNRGQGRNLFLHDPRIGRVSFSEREEVFASNLIDAIPDIGSRVAASRAGRAAGPAGRVAIRTAALPVEFFGVGLRRSQIGYGTLLNSLRNQIATETLDQWDQVARAGGPNLSNEEIQSLINTVNAATGRGRLPRQVGGNRMFTGLFWAPRFAVSRIEAPIQAGRGAAELAADLVYRNATGRHVGDRARKELAKDFISFLGTGMSVLTAFKLSGLAEVEMDPRSSDFGKLQFGNTRVDFWGGFQQPARYAAQIVTGQRKTLGEGEIQPTGPGGSVFFERLGRAEAGELGTFERVKGGAIPTLTQFLRSKAAPGPVSLAIDQATGRTFVGERLSEPSESFAGVGPELTVEQSQALEQLAPLLAIDILEAIEDQGVARGAAFSGAGFLGAGVQTFDRDGEQEQNEEQRVPIEDRPGLGFPRSE